MNTNSMLSSTDSEPPLSVLAYDMIAASSQIRPKVCAIRLGDTVTDLLQSVALGIAGSDVLEFERARVEPLRAPMVPIEPRRIQYSMSHVGEEAAAPILRETITPAQSSEDTLDWLALNPELLTPYRGEWVAFEGRRIVAHAPSFAETLRRAQEGGVSDPLLIPVPRAGTRVY